MKQAGAWILTAAVLLSACSSAEEPPAETGFSTNGQTDQAQTSKPKKENKPGLTLEPQFFNQVKELGGVKVIQNPENPMVLVNKEFALPSEYTPPDLVRPNVAFSFGDQDIEKSYMRKTAAEALEQLFAGAAENGLSLFAVSGYRSYDRQAEILAAGSAEKGEAEALKSIAPPGKSEHQSGLAMDISSESNGFQLNQQFEETKEGEWLKNHAHEYGFILRYPKGKEEITQYIYEPWHFRYVGADAAKIIFENSWTLEEYFQKIKPAE